MTEYGVITKVPPAGDTGNLASAMGQVFLDPQIKGGDYTDPHLPLGETLGNPLIEMFVQIPVFRLGELLIIDENDRDQFTRKPSKWSVECEYFDDIDAAVARVRQVTKEA